MAMVLMRIVAPMGKDHIGIDPLLQRLEPDLYLITLLGEEAVPKVHDLDGAIRRCPQKIIRGSPRFLASFLDTTEHAPMNVKANALIQPTQ